MTWLFRSNIRLWKKYDVVVSFNRENGTKVAILISQELRLPKNKVVFLSEYAQKHDKVCGNPTQRTLLTLATL